MLPMVLRSKGQIVLALIAIVAGPSCAAAADLLDVYRLAQESDPAFRSSRYALEAARQKVPEAVSALLPSIGASASAGRTAGDTAYTDTPLVHRSFNSNTWTIQLTQPIFRADNIAGYGESRAIAEAAEAQYQQAQQDLILHTAQAYFDVLIAAEALAAADAQVKATDEQLAAAEHGYGAGTGAITDVHEARSRADLARSDQVAAVEDLESKRAQLAAIIGEEPPALTSLREGATAPRPDPDRVDEWILRAREENFAVRAAAAAVRAAHSQLYRARSQRLPRLDFIASIGRNYSSGNIINPTDYATNARDKEIGIQASMPLLDAGGMHALTQEARANERKAEADLDAAVRKSVTDARDAYAGIVRSLAQVRALQSAVHSGESAVTGNLKGYQLGIRINSDVLTAQQQLFVARRDLAKARYDTLLQGLKLKAAAGELEASDLAAVNGLLTGLATP
jgi:outer membrane protein